MNSGYRSVSAVSEIAFKNGKKVKDVEIVKENNNGIIRQFMRNNLTVRKPKKVRFNVSSKTNPLQLPITKFVTGGEREVPSRNRRFLTFRRMPTPYFTRKSKSLRKFGKNRK